MLNTYKKDIFEYGINLQRKGDKSVKWNSTMPTDLKAVTLEWLRENGLFEPEGLNLWNIPVNTFSTENQNWYTELRKKDPSYISERVEDNSMINDDIFSDDNEFEDKDIVTAKEKKKIKKVITIPNWKVW